MFSLILTRIFCTLFLTNCFHLIWLFHMYPSTPFDFLLQFYVFKSYMGNLIYDSILKTLLLALKLLMIFLLSWIECRLNWKIRAVKERNCLFWILTIRYLITGPQQRIHFNSCGHVSLLFSVNTLYVWYVSTGANAEDTLCRSSSVSYRCLCWVWYYDLVCNQVCFIIFFLFLYFFFHDWICLLLLKKNTHA